MRFDVLTLFPEIFWSWLGQSVLRLAVERGLVDVRLWNFRDWSADRHGKVDDRPYGGGPGMLLCCQPVFDCVEAVRRAAPEPPVLVMLTPQGERLDQRLVEELAGGPRLALLCGRYEGFDDRIRQGLAPREISVGDFVCNGGEVPAMLLIDAVIRLIPGVLGDETSARYESFAESGMLEHPQFTRPREFRGMRVPDVLLGGDHQAVARWQAEAARTRTQDRRGTLPAEDAPPRIP
jgi:tRNA (guanine37-N1)-methyltransferase